MTLLCFLFSSPFVSYLFRDMFRTVSYQGARMAVREPFPLEKPIDLDGFGAHHGGGYTMAQILQICENAKMQKCCEWKFTANLVAFN